MEWNSISIWDNHSNNLYISYTNLEVNQWKKLLLIASVLLATTAFAEKIGVVDSQKAFFQFSETKKAQQALEGQAKKVENEARQKRSSTTKRIRFFTS